MHSEITLVSCSQITNRKCIANCWETWFTTICKLPMDHMIQSQNGRVKYTHCDRISIKKLNCKYHGLPDGDLISTVIAVLTMCISTTIIYNLENYLAQKCCQISFANQSRSAFICASDCSTKLLIYVCWTILDLWNSIFCYLLKFRPQYLLAQSNLYVPKMQLVAMVYGRCQMPNEYCI